MSSSEKLSPSDLDRLIAETFLADVRHHAETDSTNSRALQLLAGSPNLQTPLLVYAEQQTAGRGRGANRWWSNAGALTFSLVIDTRSFGLAPAQHPQISLLTGLAILEACAESLPRADFSLKWPNDVFLQGKKLAGILVETHPQRPHFLVIGVGLNVNNLFADAPEELRERAISLADVCGTTLDRRNLLQQILDELDQTFSSLEAGDKDLLARWREHCLLTGKRVTLNAGSETFTGLCRGIDETGALVLRFDSDERHFLAGTIVKWD